MVLNVYVPFCVIKKSGLQIPVEIAAVPNDKSSIFARFRGKCLENYATDPHD